MELKRHQIGLGLIGWIFMIPVMLIGIFILGAVYTGIANLYWDKRVEEMCRNDGGITVYEKVILTKNQFDSISQNIATERKKNTAEYYLRSRENIFHYGVIGNLKVTKVETYLVRSSDDKVIGRDIYYQRVGGDLLIIDFPSHFGCANLVGMNVNFVDSIFLIEE